MMGKISKEMKEKGDKMEEKVLLTREDLEAEVEKYSKGMTGAEQRRYAGIYAKFMDKGMHKEDVAQQKQLLA